MNTNGRAIAKFILKSSEAIRQRVDAGEDLDAILDEVLASVEAKPSFDIPYWKIQVDELHKSFGRFRTKLIRANDPDYYDKMRAYINEWVVHNQGLTTYIQFTVFAEKLTDPAIVKLRLYSVFNPKQNNFMHATLTSIKEIE